MSLPRFYLAPAAWLSPDPQLSTEEAHHCAEVLRMRVGDTLQVFDGQGRGAEAVLTSVSKKHLSLHLQNPQPVPPLPRRLTLAQAIPKGKTMEWIIEKATELGVAEIVPLVTDRTVVRLDPADSLRKQDKWQRVALEACKQCGQNWLPIVHPPRALATWLPTTDPQEFRLLGALTPEAVPLQSLLAGCAQRPERATVLVGPEGDFTPAEMTAALASGFLPLSMGPIVLRAETAAIFALSILAYELLSPT